jgi:antitoxin Phd
MLLARKAMKTVSSSEMKNRLGQYLESTVAEPVLIEKAGRPVAVVLSYGEYQRLQRLEDSYWAARCRLAEESGWAGPEESMKALKESASAEA